MIKTIDLIKEEESETVEFKPSLSQTDKIMGSISAFSNTKGGTVVIGVTDKGEVHGVGIGKRTIENLANGIKQNIDPMVYPSIRVEKIDDKMVVLIEIEESKQKPVLASGRAYRRVGKTNQKLGYEGIRNLALETSKFYWDERICEGASLEDIEEEKIEWFLKTRFTKRKVAIPSQMRFEDVLMNLGGAKRIDSVVKPTNAGILFFCRYPQRFFPLRILCARFRGLDLSRTTIDSLDCSGTLVEIMEQTEEFIRRNMRLFGFRTSFSFRRIDKLEYPIEALNNQIYREINGVSDETTRLELSQLVEKGLLKIKGKGRSTKYVPLVGD